MQGCSGPGSTAISGTGRLPKGADHAKPGCSRRLFLWRHWALLQPDELNRPPALDVAMSAIQPAFPGVPYIAKVRCFFGGCYLRPGKGVLLFAIPPDTSTAVWPPAGIALAALLLHGVRIWPGYGWRRAGQSVNQSLNSCSSHRHRQLVRRYVPPFSSTASSNRRSNSASRMWCSASR